MAQMEEPSNCSSISGNATGLGTVMDRHVPNYQILCEPFGHVHKKITLSTPMMRVELLTLGAAIKSVQIRNPSKAGALKAEWLNVCLGFDDPEECVRPGAPIGAVHGRFAGRIANAKFEIDGTTYNLDTNDGPHNLHGGPKGFNTLKWDPFRMETDDEIGVSFHLRSPHMDQGFPGELLVSATYTIPKNSKMPYLEYTLQARLTDDSPADATVVNLANHTYWNLNGVQRPVQGEDIAPLPRSIRNHHMMIKATCFAEVDKQLIPNGSMVNIKDTVHDYTTLKPIDEGMRATEANRTPWGYDDPVALELWDSKLHEAAVLHSPLTRVQMRVSTTCPVIVLYTSNHLPEHATGKKNERFQRHSGICLECQYFPNNPNVNNFLSTVLRKGQEYTETTRHDFEFLDAWV